MKPFLRKVGEEFLITVIQLAAGALGIALVGLCVYVGYRMMRWAGWLP